MVQAVPASTRILSGHSSDDLQAELDHLLYTPPESGEEWAHVCALEAELNRRSESVGQRHLPATSGLPGLPESHIPRRFVVEVMYRGDNGGTISELPIDDTILDRVVGDIISGQHAHVVRVFELRDVTREIAHAVGAKAEDDGTDIHPDLANFLALYGVNVPRPAPDREWEWEPDYFGPAEREPA